ncbi:ribonuclease 3-like protein 2-like [Trifolium pratense]|uniref:Ribonuclease 3-like protein 2-like n=1 Tax=Trifolium pratense TaxID=57577 RepID=A0A2K3MSX5_TRIPR|nr:ribonuclease 3-like protein 2-like [Trifolium pratense]
MEASLAAVEQIIGYIFRNKKLLEEALTHTSDPKAVSYECLEFAGDAVLGLAINSLVRAAYVSTEKLGRAAVRHGPHHNTLSIVDKIREFVDAVQRDDDCSVVLYGGSVKAPKIFADIVESIAAAVYVDVDFDLKKIMGGMYGYSLANFYEQTLRFVPDFVGCSVKLNMLVIKLIVSC